MPSGSGASVKRPYYLSEYMSFVLPFTKSRQPKGNVEAPKNNETSDTFGEETFTEDQENEEFEPEQVAGPNEVGNYTNNHGRKHDNDELSITEQINQDASDVTLSQRDSLESNDPLNPKQGKQTKSMSKVLGENTRKAKKCKTTQNQVTLEDVNKSAFEYFEKKKQAPYRPPALTNDDADVQFLLSLLPDLKRMTDKQKRKYKVGVLNLADEILDEPLLPLTTVPLCSPDAVRSYSSLSAHSKHSSRPTTECSNSTADSQSSYQDISFSTGHPPPTQDTFLPNIQYGFENDF